MSKKHTYDYGVIGNCAFTAHIKTDTNIEWMCWPRFDSSFIFGALLDDEKGGEFSVKPTGEFTSNQYYIENTNVLCTEITCEEGRYRVTDFAPRFSQYDRYYKPLMVFRKVEPLSGHPKISVRCHPVSGYGEKQPERSLGSSHIRYLGLDSQLRLTTNISLSYILDDQEFVLNETKYLALSYGPPLEAALEETAETFLHKTVDYWRTWISRTSVINFYQREAIRSA